MSLLTDFCHLLHDAQPLMPSAAATASAAADAASAVGILIRFPFHRVADISPASAGWFDARATRHTGAATRAATQESARQSCFCFGVSMRSMAAFSGDCAPVRLVARALLASDAGRRGSLPAAAPGRIRFRSFSARSGSRAIRFSRFL